MAKKYDAALKELTDHHGPDLARYLAARVGVTAPNPEVMESDVSSITMQADKVFRLGGDSGLLHAELQSSWEGDVADVTLVYNVLLDRRYGSPVKSVVVCCGPKRPPATLRDTCNVSARMGGFTSISNTESFGCGRNLWPRS
jgi:hypothetical protein